MRQVVESDRKIRALSLLKFSKLTLTDIDEAVQADSSSTADNEGDTVADMITESLKLDLQPTVSDSNIIYYVCGAIARSTIGITKCESCREALVNSSQLPAAPAIDLDEQSNPGASDFLDSVNRGGLMKPTDFLYNFAVHCWRVFEELWNNTDLKSKFLQCSGHRAVFCKIMNRATYNDKYLHYCLVATFALPVMTYRTTSFDGSSTVLPRTLSNS